MLRQLYHHSIFFALGSFYHFAKNGVHLHIKYPCIGVDTEGMGERVGGDGDVRLRSISSIPTQWYRRHS
jgi:hypothetical protein